jgi:hypothetical protein
MARRHGPRAWGLVALAAVAAVAPAQTESVLTGTFVQLNSQLAAMDADGWLQEFGWMRDIGMDTVIVQYARYGEVSYFPTEDATPAAPAALPPNESLATLAWAPEAATATRHLRVVVQPNSREWTMIPELRVFAGGDEVAAGVGYRLVPAPDARYPDPDAAQGGKLTDGRANFAWPDMVGWAHPGDRITIDLDLGEVRAVERVEVVFMRSDVSGVELPSTIRVAGSDDGTAFDELGVAGWGAVEAVAWEPLRHMLDAAERLEMQVFLGLGLDPAFWQGRFDPVASAEENIALMMRLEELYGASPALAGWYLPEEIDDRRFVATDAHEAIIAYLEAVTRAAHERTGRPVMVAPYFGMNPNGPAYAAWWDVTLARAPIDIIAMQDGVGTRRTTTEEGVGVFEALAEVAARHGAALWSDLEVFEQVHGWPVDAGPWQARPATIEQVLHQLELEAPHVEKIVVFDFTHYMSPRLGGAAEELYRGYQAYLEARGTP